VGERAEYRRQRPSAHYPPPHRLPSRRYKEELQQWEKLEKAYTGAGSAAASAAALAAEEEEVRRAKWGTRAGTPLLQISLLPFLPSRSPPPRDPHPPTSPLNPDPLPRPFFPFPSPPLQDDDLDEDTLRRFQLAAQLPGAVSTAVAAAVGEADTLTHAVRGARRQLRAAKAGTAAVSAAARSAAFPDLPSGKAAIKALSAGAATTGGAAASSAGSTGARGGLQSPPPSILTKILKGRG
jgi:hypothetical protein